MRPQMRYALAWLLFAGALVASVGLLASHPKPQAEAVVYPTSRLVSASKMVAFEEWSAPARKGLDATLSFDSDGAIHIVAQSANPTDAMATANAIADSIAGGPKANIAGIGTFRIQWAGLGDDGMTTRLIWVAGLAGGLVISGVYLVRGAGGPKPWRLRPAL